jgi:type II secretion system protein N
MRRLGVAALVLGVFGLVGALTFPTDTVVRALLDRVPLPDRATLTFAAAALRWNGLRLEQVRLAHPQEDRAFDADWLRLRPSLLGFWRDGTGRPWTVAAGTCQGTIEVGVGAEPRATPIEVSFEHVELAACLPFVMPQVQAYGRVDGTVRVRLGTVDPPQSDGVLQIRGAAWTPGGPLEGVPLRADAGALEWRLAEHRLEITKLEATSKDFTATGSGLVRLVDSVDDSVIDLRVTVTPGKTMPPLLRRYFDAIPGEPPNARDVRTFRVQGTLRDPRVLAIVPAPPSMPTRVP